MADPDLCGRTLGEFVLLERIGEGGFGVVYRAAQPLLKRDVVVKVLHERRRTNSVARDRFLREAQLASQLDHPYAAHVYAFGADDEDRILWIAMELVQGITLEEWLRERGPMPLEQLVPFFERVAHVVQDAHARGIIHRDLKPSNVMVTEREGELFPKLLDFGIAKGSPDSPRPAPATIPADPLPDEPAPAAPHVPDDIATAQLRLKPAPEPRTRTDPRASVHRLTRSGAGLGSSAYMAPEQWDNAYAVGPASDIYSLGIVAYKALTGHSPFAAQCEADYYRHHLATRVPPLGGEFPAELDRALQRALAKRPADRHASVLELASELRAALRASERELLRSSAEQWAARARAPGLLWGGDVLADVERWRRRAPSPELTELECSFVAASQRRARRAAWARRLAGAMIVLGVLGALQYRAAMQTRLAQEQTRAAQRVAEATIIQSELEQGRAALLHGEPEAQLHLAEAYRRGERSPSTAFMLARALEPRLAEQARFASLKGRMWSATFSPDGRQIVTTDDGGAQIWDAQSYRLRFRIPHPAEVYHGLYSPDGARLVTVAQDAVRLWDPSSGALVRELRQERRDRKPADYYLGALSPDGRLVAAIDAAGSVTHVWDAVTGAALAELRGDDSGFPALAFSHDGRWLAISGGDDARIYETRTWARALTLRGPRILSLAFAPTGPRIATATYTGDVAIWDVPSGARLRHLRDAGDPVDAVAFAASGKRIVAASRDGTVQVWNADSGEPLSRFKPRPSKIVAVEFDPTSRLVAAAGADGAVVVTDAALGMPVTLLEGPANYVRTAHFDPSSRRVVGASWDGTVRVWDAASPYLRWSSAPLSDACGVVTSPEPDRRFVAVRCRDLATRVWDTARDQLAAELPSVSRVDGDFASAFPTVSRAGDRAAIARGNAVNVYELPGGRLLRAIEHRAPVNAVAFAPTGRDLLSGAVDGSLLVTRDNGAQLALPASAGGIDAVAFLPDGRVVASDAKRRLRVYDRGGAVLSDLELSARLRSLRIDGTRLVTVPLYTDRAAPPMLLDLERYRFIAQLDGHVGQVFSARWVEGGNILTAGGDGTARMWDGATGQLRRTYRGSARFLADATLSPDGSLIMAGGADGLLRFWDRLSGRMVWTLQAHKSHLIGIHIEGDDIVTRGFTGEISRWRIPGSEPVIAACRARERCAIVPR